MTDYRLMNHKLHIFLTFISLGMWLPFYALMFIYYKLTGSTIETRRIKGMGAREKRRSRRAIRKEKRRSKRAKLKEDRRIIRELSKATEARRGYTPGNWNSSQNYTLACGHQISAKKQVGMFSKGLLNQTVWCEVCNSSRTVTGTLYPWDNR